MAEIVSYIIAVLIVAYVAIPLISRQQGKRLAEDATTNKLSELVHQKLQIQETKSDLEFDFQTGKLEKEDYDLLIKEQDDLLRKLDGQISQLSGISGKKLEERLEAEILAQRQKGGQVVANNCPQCGASYNPGDKFCAKCGSKLA